MKESLSIVQGVLAEPKSHWVTLEGTANALAANRDTSQVVVAGRNVFKIFSVEPDRFVEKLNLRVGKNVDLSYSCADVVWNPVDDAILATAATNGSVVTWNLGSYQKQDMKFQDHKRTVNKVCFHTTESHFLLSGSQDGTMKLFDLRRKEASSTFYSLSESVRDVQFCPHQYFCFAAVQENGYVQLWDLRRTDRFERQFAAHSGPVFTCDWHPEEKFWLATAGRDKTIKIWDMCSKESLEHSIQTIASVSRVKWQPHKKHCIASSSLVVDFNINVWDIRKSYVPIASFDAHKDVITGFVWRTHSNLIITTSKDCTLYQHSLKDATRPLIVPAALDLNAAGDAAHAFVDASVEEGGAHHHHHPEGGGGGVRPAPALLPAKKRLPSLFRKTPNPKECVKSSKSTLVVVKDYHKHLQPWRWVSFQSLSMDWFVKSAERYALHGKPLPDLCEHNAGVASHLGRPHVAQSWLILKLLYTSGSVLLSEYSHLDRLLDDKVLDAGPDKHRIPNGVTFRTPHESLKAGGSRHVSGGSHATGGADNSAGRTEEDSDSAGNAEHENTITYFASELAQGDFFFGDGEAELFRMLDYPQLGVGDEDWTLPREAFNVRHPLGDGSPPPEVPGSPPHCASEDVSEREGAHHTPTPEEEEQEAMLAALCPAPRFPPWNCTAVVVDMLQFYADQGDVQMSVSVLLVLGDKLRSVVDEALQEQWFHSYLELLSRFQLWNVSNAVIALSGLASINTLNQQSTRVNALCGSCKKFTSPVGWFCDRCKRISVCSLCHQIVRGLYVWCQGCSHGGHVKHLQEWFQHNRHCPTGCGHHCEYT